MGRPAARETLLPLLLPVVEAAGADLEDVEVTPAGKRRLVRVVVDTDGGVSLDTVAAVSQAVSAALDESPEADAALGGAPYVLEVTSPGVDRPLVAARHWRRNVGRLVTAVLAQGGEVTGRVRSADEAQVVLDTEAGPATLPLADVVRGRVQVEFSRPGGGADVDEDEDEVVDVDGDDVEADEE